MTTRIIIYIVLAGLLVWGLSRIWRDWGSAFRRGEQVAEEKRRARLERNRQEAKTTGVVDLQRGEDGVYRPRSVERDENRRP